MHMQMQRVQLVMPANRINDGKYCRRTIPAIYVAMVKCNKTTTFVVSNLHFSASYSYIVTGEAVEF